MNRRVGKRLRNPRHAVPCAPNHRRTLALPYHSSEGQGLIPEVFGIRNPECFLTRSVMRTTGPALRRLCFEPPTLHQRQAHHRKSREHDRRGLRRRGTTIVFKRNIIKEERVWRVLELELDVGTAPASDESETVERPVLVPDIRLVEESAPIDNRSEKVGRTKVAAG